MSLPAYARLQLSGIHWLGTVPDHWGSLPGRRLFAQKREPALPCDEQLSATQRYGVVPQKLFMELEDQKVMLAIGGLDNFKHVERNDFVISLRSFQGGIEHSDYSGCVSPAYTVLRPQVAIDHGYYAWMLKSVPYVSALQASTNGIRDGKNISYEQFGQIPLPVPPLSEQTAIAGFLDRETGKIDALVEEQKRLIELLKEKRQAVISHAVTKGLNPDASMKDSGVEWLGEVPEHWNTTTVGRICSYLSYGFTNPMPTADEGPHMLTANDIGDGSINFDGARRTEQDAFDQLTNKSRPEAGDVLVTKDGTLGRVAVHDGTLACINQSVALLRPDTNSIAPAFLAYCLRGGVYQDRMIYEAGGTTIKHIYISRLAKMPFACPPLREQAEILLRLQVDVAKFDQLAAEAMLAIELLVERRSALVAAAVTGKIDVRGMDEGESEAA